MRRAPSALRACALLASAALAVHELRYVAGRGSEAGALEASHGHGYLPALSAFVALLFVIALGAFLARLAAGGDPLRASRPSLRRLWLAATLGLVAVYTAQELVEGALASGHPPGLDGVFGSGGWMALPIAAVLGLGVVLLLRGAETLLGRAARRACERRGAAPRERFPVVPLLPRRAGLARRMAGRAPPRLAV